MTADYLTEGWPLSPTSTIYMDGTTVYGVRRYGIPGVTNVVLRREHADLIREVVAERIQQAKAEAWDEGRSMSELTWRHIYDGHDCAEGEMCPSCGVPNPYRPSTSKEKR